MIRFLLQLSIYTQMIKENWLKINLILLIHPDFYYTITCNLDLVSVCVREFPAQAIPIPYYTL